MTAARRLTLATCCLALLSFLTARPAVAGPPNPKHVAADAKWYLHLDVEAAKQTVLYNAVLDAIKATYPLEETVSQLKQFIGVNPLTDISGVTVYNTSFEKDVAAVIIYATVDQTLLTNALAQNRDYKETPYGQHTILSWTDNNDGKHKTGCFFANGIVVMADKEATLKMAIDVLDGAKPAGSPLVKTPAAGTFLSASADLAQADDKNVSQLLSNSEAATASATETDGKLTISINLTAKNEQTAAQIRKMADGLQALGMLAASHDLPTAAELIKQVQITGEGTKLTATFSHDSKTLLQTLQKLDQENKAKAAKNAAVPDAPPQGL
jgi:hypothetical protein